MSDLLLRAMSASDAEATVAWHAWRASVDMQDLAWRDMQILPLLNGPRLEAWLAGDEAAGILSGIVRRAWSEAQVRLGAAREVMICLRAAGCTDVTVVGALGAYLRLLPSSATRPVLELRLLVRRGDLSAAVMALRADGWMARDIVPTGRWLDTMTHVLLQRNGARLYLHWRLFPVAPEHAEECERVFLSEFEMVEAIGAKFRVLSRAQALLEALGTREETVDALPWQADAMLLCHTHLAEPIDWQRWSTQAARYQPNVFGRLSELRALGLEIPEISAPKVGPLQRLCEGWNRLRYAMRRR